MSGGLWGSQLNTEYFFRLLYECITGTCYGSADFSGLYPIFAKIWVVIVLVGYALSVIGLFVIIYVTVRLFELRKREHEYYATPIGVEERTEDSKPPRWQHIEALMAGTKKSEWREAIIEADIMLDDVLAGEGYQGNGVGEKLKSARSANFQTLQNAWEAHKVRNQIAHEGSAFDLSETLARRTMGNYEAVFREFGVI